MRLVLDKKKVSKLKKAVQRIRKRRERRGSLTRAVQKLKPKGGSKWGLKIKLPSVTFHGIRLKNLERVKREGLPLWNAEEALEEVRSSFEHFIDKGFLKRGREAEEALERAEAEVENRFSRRGIHVTFFEDEAAKWAKRNPEIAWVHFEPLGIPWKEVESYLEKRYGEPHILVLDYEKASENLPKITRKFPFHVAGGADLFLPMERIEPSYIKKIEKVGKKGLLL